ncbi:hypothetical protein EVAR_73111_1 [Eumeta japonica]|uniref:Uncharacterized protein n=1 Tax=Eumeta variegata TaxID=151549 RepID=A0A4C1TF06_EUMVA|nr:hypothetical protein EVAR_73111_1 [Eumeta japonica]
MILVDIAETRLDINCEILTVEIHFPPGTEEKTYGCAIGLLVELYTRVTISVPWDWQPRVIHEEKLCQPWLRSLFGCNMVACGEVSAVAYQQTVLEILERVVAVKLRHDAHLPASSHLFEMPGLWKARAERKLARNS